MDDLSGTLRFSKLGAIAILFLATVISCTSWYEDPAYDPGTVVSSSTCEPESLKAQVIATTEARNFMVTVFNVNDSLTLLDTTVTAPGGYHRPIIEVGFQDGCSGVWLSIDFDFGSGVIEQEWTLAAYM